MGIPELIFAIVGLIGKIIPPLRRWSEQRNGGYAVWKSDITYWTGRPRTIRERFFGREVELKKIADSFKTQNVVALSGGPGIGKSQLAAEFVQTSKRKGFWTPGGETPAQTLLSLAPHLGIERNDRSDDELLVQTRRRLQALPAKTLWVVDNLSDLDQLNTLLNETGKISILVTTQDGRENVVEGADFQTVGVLDPSPAVRLLCRRGGHDPNQPVFLAIVEEVGRLPRAVEALAVQLASQGETPQRLLEELRATPNAVELDRFQNQTAGLQIPRPESLFNALRGPVDALQPNIREALAPLGYTADLPIPMPLVEALTELSGRALIDFFNKCTGKSVLSSDGNQVTLHSLTASVIAATNHDDSLQTAVLRADSRLSALVGARQIVPAVEMSHYELILLRASPALESENEVLLAFSTNLAHAFDTAGRYEDAARLQQEVLKVAEQVFGSDQRNTLSSRNNLAGTYYLAGRIEEASRLFEETLNVMERVLGWEHPDTLGIRSNLAAAYNDAGRFEDAAQLQSQTLEVMERVLGPEHPSTLGSRNNLASTYNGTGRFDDAAQLHSETLEIRERILGPEHPDTLASRNNLATTNYNAGRYDDAAHLHRETLDVRKRVLGPEHPHTIVSRNYLAEAYRALGRDADADGLFKPD